MLRETCGGKLTWRRDAEGGKVIALELIEVRIVTAVEVRIVKAAEGR